MKKILNRYNDELLKFTYYQSKKLYYSIKYKITLIIILFLFKAKYS